MSERPVRTVRVGPVTMLVAALAANSAFAVTLLAVRTLYAERFGYRFLLWNLVLAWVPVACALAMDAQSRRAPVGRGRDLALLALGTVWLAFFPNSPYLVTDLIHLEARPEAPLWLDALVLVAFAFAGLLCGFVALGLVQAVVRDRYGTRVSWAFAVAVLGVSGFGISLGRFERWNSWDLIRRPRGIYADVAESFTNPLGHPRTVAVTALLAGFLIVSYLVFAAFAIFWGARLDTAAVAHAHAPGGEAAAPRMGR